MLTGTPSDIPAASGSQSATDPMIVAAEVAEKKPSSNASVAAVMRRSGDLRGAGQARARGTTGKRETDTHTATRHESSPTPCEGPWGGPRASKRAP